MSEFKFACPVCGQHMMCDESQGGSVMECPTCFQKIVAPQAPAPDSKFILTGTKLAEKRITASGLDLSSTAPAGRKFPGVAVVILILLFMAATAAVIYWATIIRPRQLAAHKSPSATNAVSPAQAGKAPVIAPPASDANWALELGTNEIPATPVAGRIHGQNFIMERANFANGTLTLRYGTRGNLEFGAQVNFGGAQAESLSEQTLEILADTNKSARVTLRWKDEAGVIQKRNYDSGYAMRLEFGPFARNRLPGKIWLCLPDEEKSYLLGTFTANVFKPKPKPGN